MNKKVIISFLTHLGFKRKELIVKEDSGYYIIVLPKNEYTSNKISDIISGFDQQTKIGYYSDISNNNLCIKTKIVL